jgi:hypothetical protein
MPRLSLGLGVQIVRKIGGGASFSPSSLSGLSLWLKADAGVTLSGSNVTSWADQSGNGKNMTSVVNPIFVNNAKNGNPALSFTGSEYMNGLGVFTGSSSRTFFVVYYTDNEAEISNSICGQSNLDTAATGKAFLIQARNDFLNSSPYLAGYAADLPGPAYANNVWNIATADYNGTTANLYTNGTLYNSGELALDTYNTGNCFIIGCIYDEGVAGYAEFFGGKLTEVIAYNRVISSIERQQVEAYLNAKYAIY